MHAPKIVAAVAALSMGVALGGCSDDDSDNGATGTTQSASSATAATSAQAAAAELPTVDELNGVLDRAADPNLPLEERMQTIQGGEQVPELFDVMTQSQQESGAKFQVVDPVLPDFEPNQVLASVNLTAPGEEPTLINDVNFVYEDGHWKLSQRWACNLISGTLPADQVPAMCAAASPVAPAPVDRSPAQQPAQQPAEQPEQAPQGDYQQAPAL